MGCHSPKQKVEAMGKEHVKGAADRAKGVIKDAAGKVMDDKKLQVEGKVEGQAGVHPSIPRTRSFAFFARCAAVHSGTIDS
jgi:hypothetical protein